MTKLFLLNGKFLKLVGAIVVFILLVFFLKMTVFSSLDNKHFAVFLTNGQIYFGHITEINNNTITLEHVYYLRTQTNLTTDELDKEEDVHISLVKLGKEIHGPKNKMMINRQQVLFWEELREDSDVTKAMQQYQ